MFLKENLSVKHLVKVPITSQCNKVQAFPMSVSHTAETTPEQQLSSRDVLGKLVVVEIYLLAAWQIFILCFW